MKLQELEACHNRQRSLAVTHVDVLQTIRLQRFSYRRVEGGGATYAQRILLLPLAVKARAEAHRVLRELVIEHSHHCQMD